MAQITVIILTFNEQLHLSRCIESVKDIAKRIIIVDSFSTDETESIAKKYGAEFFQHEFENQAKQFQWALDSIPIHTDWIMKLDADEYILPELASEITSKIHTLSSDIAGVILKRRVYFMDKWIKWGGYYPVKLLRIWRNQKGYIEQRWMDEHVALFEGNTVEFKYDFVDENLNNLTWWTAKHNNYATREVVDLLNKKYGLFIESTDVNLEENAGTKLKRWLKNNIYLKLPFFLRPFLYFCFRFFVKFGFLDGKRGLVWHFLQGFWYRYLIDAKLFQVEYLAKKHNKSIRQVLIENFNVNL
jgi:glycosyltransferase involved in cell wall biosynthesis